MYVYIHIIVYYLCAVGGRPHAPYCAAGGSEADGTDVLCAVHRLQQQTGCHCTEEQGIGRPLGAHQILSFSGA